MKKKIVATSSRPGATNAIIPPIERLIKEGKVKVVTIGHESSEEILQEEGIPHRTIGHYGLEGVSYRLYENLIRTRAA
ncbi:hypothetical protein COT48_00965 [Candidatus Woesearchaeota archaeon CG08_land_8_20_14_0_20_47_9]|nr:MAG: hypothetical protein COT48_00965 [Candidatus Woesearchaeota archaeon CG08_land_8_20_14_0_20_47_9]HII30175.1 hypothetical protein [Candidatus Woesearchaeota archaeon]